MGKEMGREQAKASESCANYSELGKGMVRKCKDMLEVIHRWGPCEGIQRRQWPLPSPGVQGDPPMEGVLLPPLESETGMLGNVPVSRTASRAYFCLFKMDLKF